MVCATAGAQSNSSNAINDVSQKQAFNLCEEVSELESASLRTWCFKPSFLIHHIHQALPASSMNEITSDNIFDSVFQETSRGTQTAKQSNFQQKFGCPFQPKNGTDDPEPRRGVAWHNSGLVADRTHVRRSLLATHDSPSGFVETASQPA